MAHETAQSGEQLPAPDQRSLVQDLAARLVGEVEPDELALFDETAAEYFADPEAVLDPGHRDEAVGFGIDVAMITPAVLAVAGSLVEYLAGVLVEAAGEELRPRLVRRLRRLLRLEDPDEAAADEPPALTADQLRRVREVTVARALDVGLDDNRARLLADAVTGRLATG